MGSQSMKYMGSKRLMLQNGLGELITVCAKSCDRIVDLFCGASFVSWFAAEKIGSKVLSVDLQQYSIALATAVIERDAPLDSSKVASTWLDAAKASRNQSKLWQRANAIDGRSLRRLVTRARELCSEPSEVGPVWRAYGGYYFSPAQALSIDYMLAHLPASKPDRDVCLAALIIAASKCAAAPGHTAQPFKPNRSAGPFIREAWGHDIFAVARAALDQICPLHAKKVGSAKKSDAVEVAGQLNSKDLVVVDPPYSGVQYSRFYHVLETIARGSCGPVSGTGRYPAISERPQSAFCNKSESRNALRDLIANLAKSGSTVILTLPAGPCSNGLSGVTATRIASSFFDVQKKVVKTKFSTLGGNNTIRRSRRPRSELILLLRPKGCAASAAS